MNRAEMDAIGARFAKKVFMTRSGEARIYINGLDGVKVWCVSDKFGFPEVHWKNDWTRCTSGDADAALERAMERLGVRFNATFIDILDIVTGVKTAEEVNAEDPNK